MAAIANCPGDPPTMKATASDLLAKLPGKASEKWLQGERHRFIAGTTFFVPAGAEHRFENFSPDFATWVVFWGPKGGEKG
jgi:hypothetical protein